MAKPKVGRGCGRGHQADSTLRWLLILPILISRVSAATVAPSSLASFDITTPRAAEDVSALRQLMRVGVYYQRCGVLGLTRSYGHIHVNISLSDDVRTYNEVVQATHTTLRTLRNNRELWETSRGRIDRIFVQFEVSLGNTEAHLRSACLLLSCTLPIIRAKFPRPESTAVESGAVMPQGEYFRTERQAGFVSGLTSMAAIGLSLFSQFEVGKIRKHVKGLERRSQLITAAMNETRQVVNENTKHVTLLRTGLNNMAKESKHLAFIAAADLILSHLSVILSNLHWHVDSFLQVLVNREVNPALFGVDMLKLALSSIRSQAERYHLEPATENVAAMVNFRLSYLLSAPREGSADIYIHIPLISKTKLNMFRYLNVPFIGRDGRGIMLDENHDILAVNSIHSMAVTLSSAELQHCDHYEGVYLCPISTTSNKLTSSCLGSLYEASAEGVASLCNFRPTMLSGELMAEIGTGEVLVRAPPSLSLSVELDCSDVPTKEDKHFVVKHERIVSVPKGCSLIGPSSTYQGGPGNLIYQSVRQSSVNLAAIEAGARFEEVKEIRNESEIDTIDKMDWRPHYLAPLNIPSSDEDDNSLVTAAVASLATFAILALIGTMLILGLYMRRRRRGPLRRLMPPPAGQRWRAWWRHARDREEKAQPDEQQQRRERERGGLRRETVVGGKEEGQEMIELHSLHSLEQLPDGE